MSARLQFKIEETIKKNRLDKFLFERITSVSKIYLLNLINRDNCRINGEIARGGYHLKKDDVVEIEVDLSAETAMKPENIPLEIVFEDEEIIVVNKPAEMLVHPTLHQKSGTLLNALAYYLNSENELRMTNDELRDKSGIEKPRANDREQISESEIQNLKSKIIRPGLVHRLDRKTSGLMVIAKTPRALRFLSNHFQRKLVRKRYSAIVGGIVSEDSGTINAPIGQFAEEKRWNVKADGKAAETNFWVSERFADKTLLELEPVTGRTNQLRIHCAHFGHPIIGDDRYGGREFSRLCLHAAKLKFHHPTGNNLLEFASELPLELKLFSQK